MSNYERPSGSVTNKCRPTLCCSCRRFAARLNPTVGRHSGNEDMDITQAFKDAENSLRDFIAHVLQEKLGDSWVENCGVSPDRLQKWRARRAIEEKRQQFGVVDPRLIYYADFYDLRTILKKHWSGAFSDALGDWKTMEVWLKELEKLRDPDAHRRELLPHQKHLIYGIAGEIRNRLVRYRSKRETSEDYYPRIESARDSLGNVFTYGDQPIDTGMRLRVGDVIEFVIAATDPLGEPLQYAVYKSERTQWQDDNVVALRLTEQDVRKQCKVLLTIKSQRKHHAHGDADDFTLFTYEVLPSK